MQQGRDKGLRPEAVGEGSAPREGLVERVRRVEREVAVRGAWMQAASCGVISFFTLSRSMGKIFCTNASSCCLNSRAGYLASTCTHQRCFTAIQAESCTCHDIPQLQLKPTIALPCND